MARFSREAFIVLGLGASFLLAVSFLPEDWHERIIPGEWSEKIEQERRDFCKGTENQDNEGQEVIEDNSSFLCPETP